MEAPAVAQMGVSGLEASPPPSPLLDEVAAGLDAAILLRPLVFSVMVVAIRPVEIDGKRRLAMGTATRLIAARLDASRKKAASATPLAAIGPLATAPLGLGARAVANAAIAI